MCDTLPPKNRRILSPSILAADFSCLGQTLALLEQAGIGHIHIDIMDGYFVPNISMGIPVVESIRKVSSMFFDVHLMMQHPQDYFERFAEAGADGITFHLECTEDASQVHEYIQRIKDLKKRAGIAIKPNTPPDALFPYIDKIDLALVMSVEPGFGGQSLMPHTLQKAELLRQYILDKNINIDIQMDGGINLQNLPEVLNAGVNNVVAGSAIFTSDMEQSAKIFLNKMKKI